MTVYTLVEEATGFALLRKDYLSKKEADKEAKKINLKAELEEEDFRVFVVADFYGVDAE